MDSGTEVYSWFTDDGYYSLLFQIVFGIAIGLILAPFSLGLFIFIVIYFIFELFSANRCGFMYTPYGVLARLAIFIFVLLGFLIGRVLSGDDNPFRVHYDIWDFSDFSSHL